MSLATYHCNWRIVLVHPRNPLNIGAAARALSNFGFSDLVLVAPHAPTWERARSAVGAGQVLASARVVESLAEAIGDCTFVAGTTCATRRSLDREIIPLTSLVEEYGRISGGGRGTLLFGSEKTGLSNEDLSYCHALVRIPTTAETPSMNLGQSVAVCCYELARAAQFPAVAPLAPARESAPADIQAFEHLLERMVRLLDYSGHFTPANRATRIAKLRRVLLGLKLSSYDVRALGSILAQIEWKIGSL